MGCRRCGTFLISLVMGDALIILRLFDLLPDAGDVGLFLPCRDDCRRTPGDTGRGGGRTIAEFHLPLTLRH